MAKISTSQAARRLGISPQHVVRLIKDGTLNGTRIHNKAWWKVELPDKPKPDGTP